MHAVLRLSILALVASACASSATHIRHLEAPGAPKLYVEDGGPRSGLPVVFVHGNGGEAEQWREQLVALRARGHRAIAYDLRGMGKSPAADDGDYSLAAMTGDLAALTQSLHMRRFVLVGHSYGGAVAAQFAATHPEKVAGLVLVEPAVELKLPAQAATQLSTALRTSRDKLTPQLFAAPLAPSTPAVRASVLASIARSNVDAFAGALLGLQALDLRAAVASYRGPHLAVVASSIEQPLAFQRQFPTYPVVRMDSVGHWLMLDRPHSLNSVLIDFVSRLQPTPD